MSARDVAISAAFVALAALIGILLFEVRLNRRLRAGERAALGASLEDERFDPAQIHAAASRLYAPLLSIRRGDELGRARELFGAGHVQRLIEIGKESAEAGSGDPGSVSVRLERRPRMAVARARLPSVAGEAEIVMRVEASARAWPHWVPFTAAWVFDLVARASQVVALRPPLMRFARWQHLVAYWVMDLDDHGQWRLVRVEPGSTGRHHLRSDPEGAEDELIALRAAAVAELVGDRGAGGVPFELATNLPDDQVLAARELAMVDGRFDARLIETSVIDIVERWAKATEGDKTALEPVVASPSAGGRLLGSRGSVLRSPRVTHVKVTRVRALRTPPEITVEIRVRAWRGPREPTRARVGVGVTRTDPAWWRLVASESIEHPWKLLDPSVHPFDAG